MSPKAVEISRAFQETLDLLEWPRLCEHLSKFASTSKGRYSCRFLNIPIDIKESRSLLEETKEIGALDLLIEGGITFKGVFDLDQTLKRCVKGGIASGEELLAILLQFGVFTSIMGCRSDAPFQTLYLRRSCLRRRCMMTLERKRR